MTWRHLFNNFPCLYTLNILVVLIQMLDRHNEWLFHNIHTFHYAESLGIAPFPIFFLWAKEPINSTGHFSALFSIREKNNQQSKLKAGGSHLPAALAVCQGSHENHFHCTALKWSQPLRACRKNTPILNLIWTLPVIGGEWVCRMRKVNFI